MHSAFGHVLLLLGLCRFACSITTRLKQYARQTVPLHSHAGPTHRKITLLDAHVSSANKQDHWFDKSRLISLSGSASAKLNSVNVGTTADQRKALNVGDFVVIANSDDVSTSVTRDTKPQPLDDSYEVIAVHPDAIIVARPWPNESSDKLFLFKIQSSAASFIRKIRKQTPKYTTITSTTTTPTSTTAVNTTTTTAKPACRGTVLGDLAVIHDSRIVTTSVDLRNDMHVGEYIRIQGIKFVVTEPRDAITFTISERWEGRSMSGIKGCKLLNNVTSDCKMLSGCLNMLNQSHMARTSVDLRQEIAPGQVIRILWEKHADNWYESTVTHPHDQQTLTMAGPWTGPDLKCVKACRRMIDWGTDGMIPLCGTVATSKNSPVVYTSCDLRNVLNEHDWVRIGTESLLIAHPFTDKLMTMSTRLQTTASDLKAYKLAREVPMPGTLSVVEGSATVTTTSDLRSMVGPGDLIRIFQNPMRADRFEVALPQDMYTLTISKPHPGPTASGLKGYKVVGTSMPLSGSVHVSANSPIIATSHDLTGELTVGDSLQIADVDLVVESVTPTTVTINKGWPGISAKDLKIYRSGKSAEQLTLEALAREKLKCTTIYCLSQIEARESALPFDFPRTLNASMSLSLPSE